MSSGNKRLADDTRFSSLHTKLAAADDSTRRHYHGTEDQMSLEPGRSVESFNLLAQQASSPGHLQSREQMMQRYAQIDRAGRIGNSTMMNEQSLLANASRLSAQSRNSISDLLSSRPLVEDSVGFNMLNGMGQLESRNERVLQERSQEFERQVQQSIQRVKRQEQLVEALLREKLQRARKKAMEEAKTSLSSPQGVRSSRLSYHSRLPPPDAFARVGLSTDYGGDNRYASIASNNTSLFPRDEASMQQPARRFLSPGHASLDSPELLSMGRQSLLRNNPAEDSSRLYSARASLEALTAGRGVHTARGVFHDDNHKGLKARHIKKKKQHVKKQKPSSPSKGAPVYQQMIRKTLEFFEVQPNQVELFSNIQGRRKNIIPGQVGIRCKYCSHHPPHRRGRGAVYFPGNVSAVYQSAQNMAINHFLDCCADMPPDVREQIAEARTKQQASRERKGGGTTFWINLCKSLGLEDRGDGHGLWCPGGMPATGLNM